MLPIVQIENTVRVLRECIESREYHCKTYPCDACGIEDQKILASVRLLEQYLAQIREAMGA